MCLKIKNYTSNISFNVEIWILWYLVIILKFMKIGKISTNSMLSYIKELQWLYFLKEFLYFKLFTNAIFTNNLFQNSPESEVD